MNDPLILRTIAPILIFGQATPAATANDQIFLYWMIGLFAVAACILVLEMFIPSGGLLGVMALLCALAAVGAGFKYSTGIGIAASAFLILSLPTSIWLGLKIFPYTPVGKRLILTDNVPDDEIEQEKRLRKLVETSAIAGLVGAKGKAITGLRPGGTVRIDNQDIEAFADLGMIEAGAEVQVTRIVGRQVKVKEIA